MDWVSVAITFVLAFAVNQTVMVFAALHTWIERKQSALMQDRIGANRAHITLPWKWAAPINWLIFAPLNGLGLFHPIADAIKMFMKEDFIPPSGDKFLHTLAPILSLTCCFLGFAAIPFGDSMHLFGRDINLQVANINVGILYVFSAASLGVYGVILAGFASNNNYAFLGSLRAASQMLAYELVLGLTILGVVLVYGSLDLQQIVRGQGEYLLWGWIPKWGIVVQPIAFFLFVAAGIAETKRIPYDLPEAESEIVGYFTEYSGMKFGMFFFTDFIETILIAALTVTLFLGGWQVPFLAADGFHFPWGAVVNLPAMLVDLMQIGSYLFKVVAVCWLFMTIRWTLPRFRYDQLMSMAWKGIFPIAVASLIITAAFVVFLP
ncbi:MAG TPA: NADH-quinone oxidoreductase subunit H [Candidatus Omnitrophica bacterium]|nr:NADH-quinone oxidoreductase subunit H [Candidatus Omnitrophota bacterium]